MYVQVSVAFDHIWIADTHTKHADVCDITDRFLSKEYFLAYSLKHFVFVALYPKYL